MTESAKAEWVKVAHLLGDMARLARAAAEGNEQAADDLADMAERKQYHGHVLTVRLDFALLETREPDEATERDPLTHCSEVSERSDYV